jgi:hypothetical protein
MVSSSHQKKIFDQYGSSNSISNSNLVEAGLSILGASISL